jgi:hypothetical protein
MITARTCRLALSATLGVSAALRFAACLRGGQYFFGDEERYDRGVRLHQALAHGDWAGVRAVAAMPEHPLFAWVGAAVTAAQHLLAQATRFGDWGAHPEGIAFTMALGACVLSLFSTANILLAYRVARGLGADREEALWAALLMAGSNTSFYFSRHLLPYDCGIFACLLSLAVCLRAPAAWRAAAGGALAACSYLVYNGYWFLPAAEAAALLVAWRGQPRFRILAAAWAAGFALAVALVLGAGALAGGSAYWATMAAFSRSATQGLFAEGWSLPWAYLWESEGWAGAAAAGCVALAGAWAPWRGGPQGRRPLAWLAALGAGYGLLALMSSGLGHFVVYGRTVKALVPFACLAAGWAVRSLAAERNGARAAAAALIVAAGAVHIGPHLQRAYPREFEISVLRGWGNPKRSLSVSGSVYIPLAMPVNRPDLALVNAQFLYPIRGYIGFPAGETVLREENPLSYRPYQYEGFTPRERAVLRTCDISMRLIRLAGAAGVPDDLPAGLRYNSSERPSGLR